MAIDPFKIFKDVLTKTEKKLKNTVSDFVMQHRETVEKKEILDVYEIDRIAYAYDLIRSLRLNDSKF